MTERFKLPREAQMTRQALNDLAANKKFVEIGMLPGFKLLHPSEAFPGPTFDCYEYVFRSLNQNGSGDLITYFEDLQQTPGHIVKLKDAKQGDIIGYSASLTDLVFEHVGLLREQGIVESKWNEGPVYLHPHWAVPKDWGDYFRILRP